MEYECSIKTFFKAMLLKWKVNDFKKVVQQNIPSRLKKPYKFHKNK